MDGQRDQRTLSREGDPFRWQEVLVRETLDKNQTQTNSNIFAAVPR